VTPSADSDEVPGVAELFRVAPTEFVAARDALARELREAGRRDDAARVSALRRPSVVAWGINQVAHTRPDLVDDLVAASAKLAAAQLDATASSRAALVDSDRRRRRVLDELTDAAVSATAELSAAPAGHRDAIEATLDAASLDPDLRPALVAGRLSRDAPRRSGFGVGELPPPDGSRPETREPSSPSDAPRERPRRRDELAAKRARAALAAARQEAEDAGAAADQAREVEQGAQAEVEAAARRVDDLAAALEEARHELRDAKGRATEAARAAVASRNALRRAESRVARADQAAADLADDPGCG
jgi:hypothetical protein